MRHFISLTLKNGNPILLNLKHAERVEKYKGPETLIATEITMRSGKSVYVRETFDFINEKISGINS